MRAYLAIFLFMVALTTRGQICEPTDSSQTTYYQKQYKDLKGKVAKNKTISFNKALPVYEVANFLRQKSDTNYRGWYKYFINLYKEHLTHHVKEGGVERESLYRIGLSYFFLEDYAMARTLFSKCIGMHYDVACVHYYLSLAQRKLGNEQSAEEEMKLYDEKSK